MTTEPKNELPECPEYDRWFYTARSPDKDMPYGTHMIYQVCDGDEKKFEIAESIMRTAFIAGMNTRPAKAVQGDKAFPSQETTDAEFVQWALDYYADKNNWPNGVGGRIARDALEPFARIRAALTPESEGIAGKGDGETSDGYHTFNELYEHRHALFASLLKCYPDKAWKSKKHDDGTMFDGWFIAGIETREGQATYHIPLRLWDDFQAEVIHVAPKWDGHTPDDVIKRLSTLARPQEIDVDRLK